MRTKVGDEEQIEKTLSTFHSTNLVISTQYRNMQFTKYSELIAHMLLAEKHQILLLQNSKERPPGTLPPRPNQKLNSMPHAWTNDIHLEAEVGDEGAVPSEVGATDPRRKARSHKVEGEAAEDSDKAANQTPGREDLIPGKGPTSKARLKITQTPHQSASDAEPRDTLRKLAGRQHIS